MIGQELEVLVEGVSEDRELSDDGGAMPVKRRKSTAASTCPAAALNVHRVRNEESVFEFER